MAYSMKIRMTKFDNRPMEWNEFSIYKGRSLQMITKGQAQNLSFCTVL